MADRGSAQVPIIQHPDVKRMLLKMKAYVEGLRSLIYYVALCFDKEKICQEKEEVQKYKNLIGILTPVVKSYASEKGFDVCVEAMQIFGGYGYTQEYPVEQMLRDCKITSIYEGANGIQAMDFLGRKLTQGKGAALEALVNEMHITIQNAEAKSGLEDLAQKLKKAVDLLDSTCRKTCMAIFSAHSASAFACAHPLMDAAGDIIMAWMLLWRAVIADEKTEGKEAAFYTGKIRTADFFINTMLPTTVGKLEAVTFENNPTALMDESLF
jgi:hypothetical protein